MPDQIMEFIANEALIIVPALWIIGTFLKRTPKVEDWTIPWVLVGAGIAGAIALLGASAESVIQGILVAGAAVLFHQLLKQTKEHQ